jgi:hypothetical protein
MCGTTKNLSFSILDLLTLTLQTILLLGLLRLFIVASIPNFSSKTFIKFNTYLLEKLSVHIFTIYSVKYPSPIIQ